MKYLIILLITLFSINASAMCQCVCNGSYAVAQCTSLGDMRPSCVSLSANCANQERQRKELLNAVRNNNQINNSVITPARAVNMNCRNEQVYSYITRSYRLKMVCS